MQAVYFDESGNTGQNLLDAADPVFVLGSCHFDEKQALALLDHFNHYPGPELKASRLRRTSAGQQAILNFLGDANVCQSTIAAFVVHKPFMVVTKYCDIVLEPWFRSHGQNFYERGLNLALSNLLTTIMPVVLNPKTWENFLANFVRMVREDSSQTVRDLIRQTELIHSYLESTNRYLSTFFSPELFENPNDLVPYRDGTALDPLVPAYYVLVDHWGKSLGEQFEIRADASKVLAKECSRLLSLADADILPTEQGFDRRTMRFPLRVRSITPVDSLTERQVQLADVIAGTLSGALKSKDRNKEGTFEHKVLKVCYEKQLVVDGMWPNDDVDPKKLGTDERPTDGQFDLPTYTMLVAQKHPITRRPGK